MSNLKSFMMPSRNRRGSYMSHGTANNTWYFLTRFSKPKSMMRAGLVIGVSLFLMAIFFLANNNCSHEMCTSPLKSPLIMDSMTQNPKLKNGQEIGHLSSNPHQVVNFCSFDQIMSSTNRSYMFNITHSDVMVFLHIQKTGGTSFGRHLVHDLVLNQPCECQKGKKRCKCLRPKPSVHEATAVTQDGQHPRNTSRYWLFSRYSMGWKCGLHADWTELTNCVNDAMDDAEGIVEDRRYFLVTLLREPIARFLSEWKHVQRGATWKTARHWCSGRGPTDKELPSCYPDEDDWRGVTLEEFLDCESNLAINRQTRMLADLTLVGCYNHSAMSKNERERILLQSAKENLRRMAFFGVCENQSKSQYLFESTFKIPFKTSFVQLNRTHATSSLAHVSSDLMERIKERNNLDVQLYEFAKELLQVRFQEIQSKDINFTSNWNRVTISENVPNKSLVNEIGHEPTSQSIKKKKINKATAFEFQELDDDDYTYESY